MIKDFKAFIMRGNMLDLAVAVIIGIAFGAVVTSLVNDVIMPPIGLLLGKVNFSSLFINISGTPYATLDDATKAGAAVIKYGVFLNTLINFIIVALVVFLIIKAVNRAMPPKPVVAPATKVCPQCATNIPVAAKRCPNCTSEL